MKTIMIACAALLAAPAAAQTTNWDDVSEPVTDAQNGPPVYLAGYVVPRDMPVSPPGVNMRTRDVPSLIAARVLDALADYRYPVCSATIEDRCLQ